MSVEERERQRRLREQNGLRADPGWLDWVAEHGIDGGTLMMLPIPLAEVEILELRRRGQRAQDAFAAFHAAGLASAAGAWFDGPAGGVARLLLAHPSTAELAVAEGIAAEHGGVLDFVEHATRELDAVSALIHDEGIQRSPFGQAVCGFGVDVWANNVTLVLRGDLHPEIPERIQAAVDVGALLIVHPTEPAGWDPAADSGVAAAPPVDEPPPCWPDPDPHAGDPWAHLARCVKYVAARCVGGSLATAQHLAEDIGLTVRVIYPGSAKTLDRQGDRINLYVNADHIVRSAGVG